ncbi:hypothetical protein ACMA5I_03665 [Paracoccaceae bacterium GXU_MW_L88]
MTDTGFFVVHFAVIWAALALIAAGVALMIWRRRARRPDPEALAPQGGIDQTLSQIVAGAGALAAFIALLPFGGLIFGALVALVFMALGAGLGAIAPRPASDRAIPVFSGLALLLGLIAGFTASGVGLAVGAS